MKDIKAYNKNWELRKADLDWSHRKPFLCSSSVQGCAQFMKERNPRFNWLFPSYTPKLCVLWRDRSCTFSSLVPKRKIEQNMITTLPFPLIYICIYIIHICITHITHTQFGPLDLMGQSSELGWAHRYQAIICPTPLWTTMQKIKLTPIYGIIKLIM